MYPAPDATPLGPLREATWSSELESSCNIGDPLTPKGFNRALSSLCLCASVVSPDFNPRLRVPRFRDGICESVFAPLPSQGQASAPRPVGCRRLAATLRPAPPVQSLQLTSGAGR